MDWDSLTRGLLPNLWQMYGVEVSRRDGGYDVELALPGFRPEQVEVSQHEDVINVDACNERRTIHRSFSLPDDVDPENIEASLDHGVLTIRLEQTPQAAPRRIQVGSGALPHARGAAITGEAGDVRDAQISSGSSRPTQSRGS
jgi:hypothetical protein